MKKLISLFFLIIMLFVTSHSFAQIKFGAKAGLNLSKMVKDSSGTNIGSNMKMKPGFHIGLTAEYPINKIFSVESGVFLSTKGYKSETNLSILVFTINSKTDEKLYYLDIPITAKAGYRLGSAKIYGIAGGYLGIGLSGKIKNEFSAMGLAQSTNTDISWGSDANNDDLKRLDYGLTFGAGAEITHFLIEVSYGLGLANISSVTAGGTKENNRVLGISVGYKLAGKK